jgi:hypothetical protein
VLAAEILVVCPRCGRPALIQRVETNVQLSCQACGYSRRQPATGDPWPDGSAAVVVDAWFAVPLLLQVPCEGHQLWALNQRHLDYLEQYIAKGQRRDRRPFLLFGSALGEQLPRWMVIAKNRAAVLRGLRQLSAIATP